jgi:hypothetical protein
VHYLDEYSLSRGTFLWDVGHWRKVPMLTRIITSMAVAALGVSSPAFARGGGMAMHAGGSGMAMHGHGHFDHRRFDRRFHFARRFNRNLFLSGWGWGGWGGYGDSGYGNTTVVAFPQAVPKVATGSTSSGPCHWNDNTFTVPSSAGGTRQVSVVSCH